MTAPGRQPALNVQIFGLEKDRSTRAALRFFKERRVGVSLVDLRKRPMEPAELRRFVERLGARALLDEASETYRATGLGYLRMVDLDIVERIQRDQRLLRLPLIRHGAEVTAGPAESTWGTGSRTRPAPPGRVEPDDRADRAEDHAGQCPAQIVHHGAGASQDAQTLADPDEADQREHSRDQELPAHVVLL